MTRPRLLDLFCGAGGAAMGYHRAGFDVVGVDLSPQPRFPFEFHQADAMTFPLEGFDSIHASPPCQAYSRMRHLPWLQGRDYPELLEPTRDRLDAIDTPWIIENVEDAPLHRCSNLFGCHGVLLCGLMFDLRLYRHRAFETTFSVEQPAHPEHEDVIYSSRYLNKRYSQTGGVAGVIPVASIEGHAAGVTHATKAMGIDWMSRDELRQAIPPAFTEYLGKRLMEIL